MSTFLQLLRISFWMLPVQRWLTVGGTLLCLFNVAWPLPFGMPGSTLPAMFLGASLVLLVPVLAGGIFFRMLSAPRPLQLLPHARGRLLAGAIAISALATLAWMLVYAAAFVRAPAQFRPDLGQYGMMFVLTLGFATQAVIFTFVASRGPLWLLLLLLLWNGPALVLRGLGFADASQLLTGPVGLAMVPAAWLAFGIWYLRVRRIGATGWSGMGSAAASAHAAANPPASREDAMQRWLLGANTPVRMGLQWLLGATLLTGVQLVLARGYDNPRAVAAMLFGTLSLGALAIGAVAFSIAARSRGLWLTGGRLRLDLHAWCERVLLRVVLAIVAPFALLGIALWLVLPARPPLSPAYLAAAMLAPGLGAAWFGLMQLRRSVLFDVLAGLCVFAGWLFGVVAPLSAGTARPNWWVVIAQFALVAVLREVGRERWRRADWPRARAVSPG